MSTRLPVNVFWGEHRTSERLAMAVKEELEKKPQILAAGIPFIEYTQFEWNDYIELLYRQQELEQQGVSSEEFNELMRTQKKPAEKIYDKQLAEQYGPVSYNLHDGVKLQGFNTADVEFWIPNTITEDRELSDMLIDLGNQHNLDVRTRIHRKKEGSIFNIASPESIIVELYQPAPEETMQYPTEELKKLAEKYSPAKQGTWYHNQIAKTNHPLFLDAVAKYSDLLTDVLLVTNEMNLSMYEGNQPRMELKLV